MEWQRARTDSQKQQRLSEIIDATARLYRTKRFEEITLAAIAREARFTRSNLYKYFNSKEEIFFEFLKHDILLWRRDLVATLQQQKVYSVKKFAAVWVEVQNRHGRMLSLISIAYNHLEKKSSLESLVDFKRTAKTEFSILSELLCRFFPALGRENAVKFLNLQLAMSIGLFTMTNLSQLQQQVLERPDFEQFKMNFTEYFEKAVEYLLLGL